MGFISKVCCVIMVLVGLAGAFPGKERTLCTAFDPKPCVQVQSGFRKFPHVVEKEKSGSSFGHLSVVQMKALRLQRQSQKIRWFMYDLDKFEPRFNTYATCRRPGADYQFIQQMLSRPGQTTDPARADIFIVPCLYDTYRRCEFYEANEEPPQSLLSGGNDLILDHDTEHCWEQVRASETFKSYSRRHLWFFTHYEILLSSLPSVHDIITARIEIPFLDKQKNPGEDMDWRYWQAAKESRSRCGIVVPYISDVDIQLQAEDQTLKEWDTRQNFLTYRHEDCSTGRCYRSMNCRGCDATRLRDQSSAVGDAVDKHLNRGAAAKISLGRVPISEYTEELLNSKYCLVIRGDTPSTHALYDSIAAGCIPVIVSDDIQVAIPFAVSHGGDGPSGGLNIWNFSIHIRETMWLNDVDAAVREIMKVEDNHTRHSSMVEALTNVRRDLLWQQPGSEAGEKVLTQIVDQCI